MAKEYVPFDAYGLLRRIVDKGPQRVRTRVVLEDTSAHYLVSRGLASPNERGDHIENTEAGRLVGQIDYRPPAGPATAGP